MSEVIRVLQVEDSVDDAELILLLLKNAGYQVNSQRVEAADQLEAALKAQAWDVIIADYHLPEFDAPAALRMVQSTGTDIPFIVVSGAIGEDVAVGMMKSGAHDYLLKDRLERLAPAVDREIREARIRKQHRQAEEERTAAYAELAAIHSNAPAALLVVNGDLRVEKLNNLGARLSGRSVPELIGSTVGEAVGCVDTFREGSCSCGAGPDAGGCLIAKLARDTLQNGTKHESIEVCHFVSVGAEPQKRCYLFSVAPLVSARNRKALICALDITGHKSL